MLDNGHTKSLSKEAYKWSNRVGARCTDTYDHKCRDAATQMTVCKHVEKA